MAGAAPRTEWLQDSFGLDSRGFIVTRPDLANFAGADQWPLNRPPLMLETSVPGIFAVGDTRAGSIKRVASDLRQLNKRKWHRLQSLSYRITIRAPLPHKHVIARLTCKRYLAQRLS
jgi:hypothetical protein